MQLLDNVSGNRLAGCIRQLQDVREEFLPENTISKMKAMYAGIIACIKGRYRIVQYNRVLDAQVHKYANIDAIDQLNSMKYVKSM